MCEGRGAAAALPVMCLCALLAVCPAPRQLRQHLGTELGLVRSPSRHSRAAGMTAHWHFLWKQLHHPPSLFWEGTRGWVGEGCEGHGLPEVPGARTFLSSTRPRLPDKALTKEKSLIPLIQILILLCLVAKAEKMQFNPSGHTGTCTFRFWIPASSPVIYYSIWSRARVSQVRLSHPW